MSRASARTASALTAARAASAPPWDLVVIGGGTAGLVASRAAGGFGSRVLLIERQRYGGECLWTGCVPSKALLAAAHVAHDARASGHLGVAADVEVDFGRVMEHVQQAMQAIRPADDPPAAHAEGVHTLDGSARFTGSNELEVDGCRVQFRHAVVATGSAPVIPDILGFAAAGALTVDTFWSLTELPERLLIVGGGAAGCELGQAMVRLGSQVTLVQRGPHVSQREGRRASERVRAALEADGVDVRVNTTVASFDSPTSATLEPGGRVDFDRVLVVVGRQASTRGLGLAEAGVKLDDRGQVIVDRSMRTSNPTIWAAGDVTPMPHFTHAAGVFGSVAGTNAILGLRRRVDPTVTPRVLYTQPEVAAIGISPDDASAHGCRVLEVDHDHLDRAVAEGRTDGFTQLVVDKRGRLRGAVVVSPRAGETISEITVAMAAGVSVSTLGGIMHAYPSYTDGIYNAALRQLQREFSTGPVGIMVQLLRQGTKAFARARFGR